MLIIIHKPVFCTCEQPRILGNPPIQVCGLCVRAINPHKEPVVVITPDGKLKEVNNV